VTISDVYLHVGPVKTGSSYLQSIMRNSRDALRGQGILLPITHPNEFFPAANDVHDGQFILVETPDPRVPGPGWPSARLLGRAGF